MDPSVFWKPSFEFKLIPVFVTQAVDEAVNLATLMSIVEKAEQARKARGIEIGPDQMYYIRLQLPPNPRLVTVVFIWMKDQVQGFVAYYDEIAAGIEKAQQSGDGFRKLPGNPFDTSRV